MDGFPFLLELVTPVPLKNVILTHQSLYDITLTQKQEMESCRSWNRSNTERSARKLPPLMNLPLYRPVSWTKKNDRFEIEAGIITYKQTLYLSKKLDNWNPVKFLGAGLSVVPVCADGHILIGQRSPVVHNGMGLFHVTAGHAHPDHHFRTKPGELLTGVLLEMEEEMFLQKEDIVTLDYLGLGVNKRTSKSEFLIRAQLRKKALVYLNRWTEQVKNSHDPEFDAVTTLQSQAGSSRATDLCKDEKFTIACRMALHAHYNS